MGHNTRTKLFALLSLVLCLTAGAIVTPLIAASTGRHQLAFNNAAEQDDPPEVALGIAMGAFRGLFVNYLWIRANDLKQEGRFQESVELARAITKLQPRFPRVWAFHAWNLSYNISVATQTPDERWQWVRAGTDLLKREGIPANPNDMLLHRELSWIYLHKIGGYTDDSNRYYKRQIAADWTVLLGDPPRPSADARDRDAVIERFAQWLQPIADAPDTLDALYAEVPAARTLVEEIEARTEFKLGIDLLRRHAMHTHINQSIFSQQIRASWGPANVALAELLADPRFADAWPALIAHLRRREIIDTEFMNPTVMIRYTRKYGPLDWRLPAAHSLYWAAIGVERGLERVTDANRKDYDFLNTDRLVLQSIQELWRYGDLYFNFLDFVTGNRGYYQGTPNEYFIPAYGDLAYEIAERGGYQESSRKVYTQYSAGYENFLIDAVLFYYRRGQIDEANKWYEEARIFPRQNIHDRLKREYDFSRPLDEFVTKNLFDRFASPNVAVTEIVGALQGSYNALLQSDPDRFRSQFNYAALAHAYYMKNQYREVLAASGAGNERMEVVDRDFTYLAGGIFAAFIGELPPPEAITVYNIAPPDLRQRAYDVLKQLYEPVIADGQLDLGAPFEVLFPEPAGMDAFRADLARKELERSQGNVQGIGRQ